MGNSFADAVLNAFVPAELFLLGRIAVLIHKENVRVEAVHGVNKIQYTQAVADGALFHAAQRLQHILPLLLRIDRISAFQMLNILI